MIGILALQGGYEAHAAKLQQLAAPHRLLVNANDLAAISALIIPGGESTTILRFLKIQKMMQPLIDFCRQNKPVFATCAGAILLSKTVQNPSQESLGILDVVIERNSYGRQLQSQIVQGVNHVNSMDTEMVFIRAPKFLQINTDAGVEILASYHNEVVAVRQGNCVAATFHPELSADLFWHEYFLGLIEN